MDSNPPPASHDSSLILNFSSSSNFPILAIAIVGILITAFLLVSYYIFVIKCCLNLHQMDHFHRFSFPGQTTREDPIPSQIQPGSVSRGLDDSLIRLIPITQFKKERNQESEQLECAVCLSDFKQGENLRIIPNCSHAFHIDCIDIWLQSNASCPVCRSSISSNTLCAGDSNPKSPNRLDDEYVVVEIVQNGSNDEEDLDLDSEMLSAISIAPSPWEAVKEFQTSFDGECAREEGLDLDGVRPIRRSVSMDSWRNREGEGSSSGRGVRRSCFAFGGGRNAVLPLQLES